MISETVNRRFVQVVVMVVADQNRVDGREVFKPDAGRGDALDASEEEGGQAAVEDGVREDVDSIHLDKKRGVPDPGDLDMIRGRIPDAAELGLRHDGSIRWNFIGGEGRGFTGSQAEPPLEKPPEAPARLIPRVSIPFRRMMGRGVPVRLRPLLQGCAAPDGDENREAGSGCGKDLLKLEETGLH
jgi:hypothetical protein